MSNQFSQSVLSPRAILKFISNGFQGFRTDKTLNIADQPSTDQFLPYLQSINTQYRIYKSYKKKKQQSDKLEQPGYKQQIYTTCKIPLEYFQESSSRIKLCQKSQLSSKQYQLTSYLDQVQMIIFNKISKYPTKSFNVVTNVIQIQSQTNQALQKIKFQRKYLQESLIIKNHRRQKVLKIALKAKRFNQVLELLEFCKKMKKMRRISQTKIDKVNQDQYQFLQNLKPKDLIKCNKINSLGEIASKLQHYRTNIKQKISKEFQQELNSVLKNILAYNRQQWIKNQIPNNAFMVQVQDNYLNKSILNVSILDQSLFDLHGDFLINIQIQKLKNFCKLIDIYNIWEDIEVSEILIRNLLRSNVKFNKDLQDYISWLLESKKIVYKSTNKWNYIHMKFYYKLVKVYFQLLKKLLNFIRNHRKDLPFLIPILPKIYEFIQARVLYFLNLKPANEDINKDDLCYYLSIIDFWVGQEDLYEKLKLLRVKFIEDHLVALQTKIMVKEFRGAIDKSTFKSISIPSSIFGSLQYILSWGKQSIGETHQGLEMSMSLYGVTQVPLASTFKAIDKILIIQGTSYKICETFVLLIKYVEHYLQLYMLLEELRQNILQKICDFIGFYVWYNKKTLVNDSNHSQKKSIKSICLMLNVIELIKHIVSNFQIQSKKVTKLMTQIQQCLQQIKKEISIVPLLMLEEQVQILYQSRIKQRKTIPTPQTVRMIQIIKSTIQCLNEYFSAQKSIKILSPSIKMIYQNYFGYLINMENRGKEELKWFLDKLTTLIVEWFPDEIQTMQRQLKSRK